MTMVIMMAICESHVMMMNQVCEMLREKRVAASNRFSFDDLFWLVF